MEDQSTDTSTEVENIVEDSDTSTPAVGETPVVPENGTEIPGESGTPEAESEVKPDGEILGESETPDEKALSGKGAKKKIGKLTAKNYALQAENDRLKAASEQSKVALPKDRPKEEDFEDYAQYEDALLDYKLDKRDASRKVESDRQTSINKAQERAESFESRADVLRESNENFDDIAKSPEMLTIYDNAPHLADIIEDSKVGPEISLYLGENPDVAVDLAQMDPYSTAREIGKLEAKLSQTPKPKAVSKAPKPITPISGGGAGGEIEGDDPHGDKLTMKEWQAREDKRMARKRG